MHPFAAGGSSIWGDWARGTLHIDHFDHLAIKGRPPDSDHWSRTQQKQIDLQAIIIYGLVIQPTYFQIIQLDGYLKTIWIFEAGRIDAEPLKEDGASWNSRKARVL